MKMLCKILLSSLAVTFIIANTNALTVGSLTTPSSQASIAFPNGATNIMLGFTLFEQGFTLANATTTCTFNAFYPVSGLINLNNGVLSLLNDFIYTNTRSVGTVFGGGVILGNGHSLELPRTVTNFGFPTSLLRVKDLSIVLNGETNLLSQLHCSGASKIAGRNKALNFNSGSSIIVRPRSQLIFENVELKAVQGSVIRCVDDSASIIFRACTLNLSGEYTFSRGSILFDEDTIITGTNKFNYTTRLSSTIASMSSLTFGLNTTFSYAPARANNRLLFMNDATSALFLQGATLISTRTGLNIANGTLMIDRNVTLSSQARFNAEALVLNSKLTVQVLGGANLNLFGKVRYG